MKFKDLRPGDLLIIMSDWQESIEMVVDVLNNGNDKLMTLTGSLSVTVDKVLNIDCQLTQITNQTKKWWTDIKSIVTENKFYENIKRF